MTEPIHGFRLRLIIRMRDRTQIQLGDAGEVARAAGVQRHTVGNRAGCNQRVVCAGRMFPPGRSQGSRDIPERPSTLGIEWQNREIRFRLLQMLLPRPTFSVSPSDMWADGKLRECDSTYHRLIGKLIRDNHSPEQDDGRGVQHASAQVARTGHNDASITLSTSERRASGSTSGRWRRRRISSVALKLRRGSGRSSATGTPSRVTTIRSPRSTRRSTSPPLFRRSRTLTNSVIPQAYHR